MADVSCLIATTNTGNVATYTSGAFTPSGSDPIIAVVSVTGETSTDWAVTDSQGGTWVKESLAAGVTRVVKNTSADFLEVWRRTTKPAASSTTVTFSHASGAATGCTIVVLELTGVTRLDSSQIRSRGRTDNIASGVAPAVTLDQTTLTGNLILSGVFLATSSPGTLVPSTWSTVTTAVTSVWGYATPTTGGKTAKKTSGFTSNTVTWASTFGSAGCCWALEIDTSAASSPQDVNLTGIASAEAFGTVRIDQTISLTGIASAEAFGTVSPVQSQNISLTGIASAEAFGTPSFEVTIPLGGIASAEAFGTPTFTMGAVSISLIGIASEEAFGTVAVGSVTQVTLTGIPSEEAFGTVRVDQYIALVGIPSAEAFGGISRVDQFIILSAIPSAEAFGVVTIEGGAAPVLGTATDRKMTGVGI